MEFGGGGGIRHLFIHKGSFSWEQNFDHQQSRETKELLSKILALPIIGILLYLKSFLLGQHPLMPSPIKLPENFSSQMRSQDLLVRERIELKLGDISATTLKCLACFL